MQVDQLLNDAWIEYVREFGHEETSGKLAKMLVCSCFESGFGDAKFTFPNRAIVTVVLEKNWARNGVLERQKDGE